MRRAATLATIRIQRAKARATVQLKLWALVVAERLMRFGLSQTGRAGRPEA